MKLLQKKLAFARDPMRWYWSHINWIVIMVTDCSWRLLKRDYYDGVPKGELGPMKEEG